MKVPSFKKPALIGLTGVVVVIVIAALSTSQWGIWLGVRQPPKVPIGTVLTVHTTAYSSSPHQTDSTPCTTAAGTKVRAGVAATNQLPFGAVIEVTDSDSKLSGNRFIVEDRTSPRVSALDIWFDSTEAALDYGKESQVEVTVIAYEEPGEFAKIGDIEQMGFWDKTMSAVNKFSYFLRTQLKSDVNKYDVNCF